VVRNYGFSEKKFFVVCDDIWIAIYPSFVVVNNDNLAIQIVINKKIIIIIEAHYQDHV